MIRIKRIYDKPDKNDGFRILVDRLWPRGISKENAKIDLWLKEIAPSNELRKWFSHDPKKWTIFEKKYKFELTNNQDLIKEIKKLEKTQKIITLLYSAKDEEHNNALTLIEFLKIKK
ncbi:MAG: DUF488 domain-containing protein [Candidatus ainarchaeum sp.]|nr:DUF488 domain-containing protein [Candidatus ainarchaeum sp.]